jgi:hypothetical protein
VLAVELVEDIVEDARAREVDVVHPDDIEHEHVGRLEGWRRALSTWMRKLAALAKYSGDA